MKVLHFSALDGQTGAGIAAARIHQGLRARGIDSRMCVAFPSQNLPASFSPQLSLPARLRRALSLAFDNRWTRYVNVRDPVISTGLVGLDIGRVVDEVQPDIVQLHWIAGNSFRLKTLAGIRQPIVWRLADQWPFCGVRHYEPDPSAYTRPPPARMSLAQSWSNPSEHVRHAKQGIYRTLDRLAIACPSAWMASCARQSALFAGRPVEVIPTSCDTDLFHTKEMGACRKALGLEEEARIVLVGATSQTSSWKGMDLFMEAMTKLAGSARTTRVPIRVVTFGSDPFDMAALQGQFEVHHLGPVRDRRMMAILYNAADVFVSPSRMENLSNAVLESLACGTPAVAFRIGGMPEMIDHQGNGFLAEPGNPDSLSEGIAWVLEQGVATDLQNAARAKILRSFSMRNELDRYTALYSRLLETR